VDEQAHFLAAEECPPNEFVARHTFDDHDERLIRSLMSHGPVLIRGGRGAGKSALMIEAARRLKLDKERLGIYLSLRYLPLLKTTGDEYIHTLVGLAAKEIARQAIEIGFLGVPVCSTLEQLKTALIDLSRESNRRIVLLFDDPAHIGREASLDEFFDSFRMLSSAEVSCKASIYPGVTQFGVRFDVFNDATVIDVSKDERVAGYDEFFLSVLRKRKPEIQSVIAQIKNTTPASVAGFIGRSVLGNMRSFVIALEKLETIGPSDNINVLTRLLIDMSGEHFWGLIEEVIPKLGRYEPLGETSRQLAEVIFALAGEHRTPNVVVRRDICQSYAKPLEILEYVGFIAKREASRAVKGGRGPRYRLNLSLLLENVKNKKLSTELIEEWSDTSYISPFEIAPPTKVTDILLPDLPLAKSLSILELPVERLVKSPMYTYGLTADKLQRLKGAGFLKVEDLANATDDQIDEVQSIGPSWVRRIRDLVAQAVWM
jgi:hypothetical protein